MLTKHRSLKILAAFTAISSSIFPVYAQAQLKGLPSIELNFDVLQKLDKNEEADSAVHIDNNPQPAVIEAPKHEPAPAQQETKQKTKKKNIAKDAVTAEPAIAPAPVIAPAPAPVAKTVESPVIINKEATPEEPKQTQETVSTDQDAPKETKTQQVKKAFGNVGEFFKKIPSFVANKNEQTSGESGNVVEEPKSDSSVVPAEEKNDNISEATKAVVNKKEKVSSEAEEPNPFSPEDKAAKKQRLALEKLNKKTSKEKEETKNIPMPRLKNMQDVPRSIEKPDEKISKKILAMPENNQPVNTVITAPKVEVVKIAPEKIEQPITKPESKEEAKTPEIAVDVNAAPAEKAEGASDSMWKKFLDNAKIKASEPKVSEVEEKHNDVPQSPVIVAKPNVPAPVVLSQPENKDKQVKEIKQKAENSVRDEIAPQKVVEKPQNIKPVIPAVNDNEKSSPSISDSKSNKVITNSSIENKMVESQKILSEKSKDTAKVKDVAAPIPDAVSEPLEVSTLTPPANAPAITLKELDKKPTTQENNGDKVSQPIEGSSLLSFAFEGNNIEIPDSDKEKISSIVKPLLSSNHRIKVMSYAKGVDGDINSSRRISLQRAIAVRAQMIQVGLDKTRINVQAIGNNTTSPDLSNSVSIYVVE